MVCGVLLWGTVASASAASPAYTIVTLPGQPTAIAPGSAPGAAPQLLINGGTYWNNGTSTGTSGCVGADLNDSGEVVGANGNDGCTWQNGKSSTVTASGADEVALTAINDSGTIVGLVHVKGSASGGPSHPWIWTKPGGGRTMGTGGSCDIGAGACPYEVDAIAGNGTSVGSYGSSTSEQCDTWDNTQAVQWSSGGGGPSVLAPVFGGSDCSDAGASDADSYSASKSTAVGSLMRVDCPTHGTTGCINQAWSWPGGALPGTTSDASTNGSAAQGINDSGQIVGYDSARGSGDKAVIWQNGQMTDLNTLIAPGSGWQLQDAIGINDEGDIAGYGTLGGFTQGFLLEPDLPKLSISDPTVIEPSSGETSEADFKVSLSTASSSPVSVTVSTADGSARAGVEYTQTSKTLTFSAGSTGPVTFAVPVIGGAFNSGTLSFSAQLSSPTNATVATGSADAKLVAVSVSGVYPQGCVTITCSPLSAGAARGGTPISIVGSGFTGAESVEFVPQDGSPTVTIPASVVDDNRIDVSTPDLSAAVDAAQPGHAPNTNLPVDIVVEVPDGAGGLVESAKTPADVFSFDIPVVNSVTPSRGPATGGDTITVNGQYLTGADNLSFNAPSGEVQIYPVSSGSDTSITFTVPDLTKSALAAAIAAEPATGLPLGIAVDVPVTGAPSFDELTSFASSVYNVVPFEVQSVSPTTGPVAPLGGSQQITISGVGFVQSTDAASGGAGHQQVIFQPQAAGASPVTVSPSSVSDSSITVTVPSFISFFRGGKTTPLSIDVRVRAALDGAPEETQTSAGDVFTIHLPEVHSVSSPPGCHPGSTIVLTGQYLSSLAGVELSGTGYSGAAIRDDGGRQIFAITANPSDVSASFDLPDISNEAKANGGHLVLDTLPLISSGPGQYLPTNAGPTDKLTWDQSTGIPCGPGAATVSANARTATVNPNGTVTVAAVSCPEATGGCTVSASLTAPSTGSAKREHGVRAAAHRPSGHRSTTLSKSTVRLRAGRTAKVKLRLKHKTLVLLRRRHRLKTTLHLQLRPRHGRRITVKHGLELKAPSKHHGKK